MSFHYFMSFFLRAEDSIDFSVEVGVSMPTKGPIESCISLIKILLLFTCEYLQDKATLSPRALSARVNI